MAQHEISAQLIAVVAAAQKAAAEVNALFDAKVAEIRALLQGADGSPKSSLRS
jgi:hypothetical protein